MDDVYNNIIDYCNPSRKRKFLLLFDDIITDIMSNKKFQSINFFTCIITQSYFSVPKEVRLNSTNYLIRKIHNKRELQNIANNHSAHINYKEFMKIYRKCASEHHYSTLIISFNNLKKMALTEELKTLDDKTTQAENLDREATKISALSSKEMDKYEYLTVKI